MKELWKPIPGYEGLYSISSRGRVRREARIVLPHFVKDYPRVKLSRQGKYKAKNIHVLVAEAFIGPRPEGLLVNHRDGNKRHSDVSNLEYVTPSENVRHAYRLGLIKPQRGRKNGMYGKRSPGFRGRRHSVASTKKIGEAGLGNQRRQGKRLLEDHIARLRAGNQQHHQEVRVG